MLKIFKRQKLENALDVENTLVELPKCKVEMSIAKLVNDHDAFLNMHGYAAGDHMVKVNDKDEMSVNDLVKSYQAKCNELEEHAKNAKGDDGGEPGTGDDDINPGDVKENAHDLEDESEDMDVGDRGGDKSLDNEDEEEDHEDKKKDKTKNEADKRALAKKKAAALKNAHLNARDEMEMAHVDLAEDQVARGKARYGSN